MGYFLFFLLAALTVGAVLGMIISKNQAYNAIFLILAFACMGGLFALLEAPFIAVVQIIIYAGAIMVLFVFVVMMINVRSGIPAEKKEMDYLSFSSDRCCPYHRAYSLNKRSFYSSGLNGNNKSRTY